MKLVAYEQAGVPAVGLLSGDGLQLQPLPIPPEQAQDGIACLFDHAPPAPQGPPIPLQAVTLRAPLPRPRRNLFCVGKNYHDHAREFAGSGFDSSLVSGGEAVPEVPIVFSKLPDCIIPSGAPIPLDPTVSTALDYEVELAVIIGRAGRGISKAAALDHVWGYTIVNDVTARDLQGRHRQWLIGKSQDGFCPMGPAAVTAEEIDLADTRLRCWVNGELRQDANTADLIFDVPTLIETLSAGITLLPGDVIATGTPAGVGIGFDPPRYLAEGDLVTMEIDGIGRLENRVSRHPGKGAAAA